jgi:hypothetical protein
LIEDNPADVYLVERALKESPADVQRTAMLGAACHIRKPSMLDDLMREVGQGVEDMLMLGD